VFRKLVPILITSTTKLCPAGYMDTRGIGAWGGNRTPRKIWVVDKQIGIRRPDNTLLNNKLEQLHTIDRRLNGWSWQRTNSTTIFWLPIREGVKINFWFAVESYCTIAKVSAIPNKYLRTISSIPAAKLYILSLKRINLANFQRNCCVPSFALSHDKVLLDVFWDSFGRLGGINDPTRNCCLTIFNLYIAWYPDFSVRIDSHNEIMKPKDQWG
jgi:hypothetical protein